MKKLMKPLVFLFAIAVSTGAYAQQSGQAKLLNTDMKVKAAPAKVLHRQQERRAVLLPENQKHIQRALRSVGLPVTREKQ